MNYQAEPRSSGSSINIRSIEVKQLITKSDGVTPIKSKLHALQKLDKLGIGRDLLIEENGQFYYETAEEQKEAETVKESVKKEEPAKPQVKAEYKTEKSISWETDVFNADNERIKLYIPGTDVEAVIMGKHPAGQNRTKNAFEISIDGETFIMSVDLLSKIFKVRG